MATSTLTDRGQISIPAALRKKMRLKPGQRLRWEGISEREARVVVESGKPAGPLVALGYARKLSERKPRRTAGWMKELRAGERPA
jgi:AbrB family looped-hinge helix DNA binding protein